MSNGVKYICEKCGCNTFEEISIVIQPEEKLLFIDQNTTMDIEIKLACKQCYTLVPFKVKKAETVTYTFILKK